MSEYGASGSAWDGGPPGAEADYAQQPASAAHYAQPTTDPWTGVAYTHLQQAGYNYNYAPGYPSYNYGTDYYSNQNYYQGTSSGYPPAPNTYNPPPKPRSLSRSPIKDYPKRRGSYRSKSRSVSPYGSREKEYRRRDDSYERERRSRSRSLRRRKYSSSNHSSSRSRSGSRPSKYLSKKKSYRRSVSSSSSYGRGQKTRDLTPPPKHKSRSRRHSSSAGRSDARTPSHTPEKKKGKDRKTRSVVTPPKTKHRESSLTPPRAYQRTKKSSETPPQIYIKKERSETPKKYKSKDRSATPKSYKKVGTPPRKYKGKESSVTPPKSYARRGTSSSHSRTPSPPRRRRSPKSRRKSSHSSSRTPSPPARSRSKSRSHKRSRSRRQTKSRSRSRRPTPSRRRSVSKTKKRRSTSRSGSSRSGSEERRGQFTVADRKLYWKKHRSSRKDAKTPPKELKPPPGAVEKTQVDDIQYGVPPEVEGPNFADLIPSPDQAAAIAQAAMKKPMPIKNDGSFLEMFKQMHGEKKEEAKPEIKKPVLPFIGKRRGGRVLKTGIVKKAKAIDEQTVNNAPKDAWSLYMQEVKKYRDTSCEEERKTRPLVK